MSGKASLVYELRPPDSEDDYLPLRVSVSSSQTNERADWFFEPMLSPITPRLQDYLSSDWYEQERFASEQASDFVMLLEPIVEFLGEKGIHPFDRKRIMTWLDHND